MFNIGAKVRLREDLEVYDIVGPIGICYDMREYCGNTYIIRDVNNHCSEQPCYLLEGVPYSWSAEMFSEVEGEEYNVGDIVFSYIFEDITDSTPLLCEVVSVTTNDGFYIKPIGIDVAPRKVGAAERPEEIKVKLIVDTIYGKAGETIKGYKWHKHCESLLVPAQNPFKGVIFGNEFIMED